MRVLLVEDDTATARSIELALASEGIVCDVANLGEEGLEINREFSGKWPSITQNKPALSTAEEYRDTPNKFENFFSEKPGEGN